MSETAPNLFCDVADNAKPCLALSQTPLKTFKYKYLVEYEFLD